MHYRAISGLTVSLIVSLALAACAGSDGTAKAVAPPADDQAQGHVSTTDGQAQKSGGQVANKPLPGVLSDDAKLTIGQPLLDSKKKARQMSAADAAAACARLGSRLPSARELGEWSVAHGSKGYLGSDGAVSPGSNFSAIRIASAGKIAVEFYLDTASYQAPDVTWTGWFWSSTKAPGTNSDYSFSSADGGLWPLDASEISGVRCMSKL